AYGNLGWLLLQRREPRQALARLEKGLGYLRTVLDLNPDNPNYLKALRNQYWELAGTQLQLGDHAAAARTAATFLDVFRNPKQANYLAARILGRCIPVA